MCHWILSHSHFGFLFKNPMGYSSVVLFKIHIYSFFKIQFSLIIFFFLQPASPLILFPCSSSLSHCLAILLHLEGAFLSFHVWEGGLSSTILTVVFHYLWFFKWFHTLCFPKFCIYNLTRAAELVLWVPLSLRSLGT